MSTPRSLVLQAVLLSALAAIGCRQDHPGLGSSRYASFQGAQLITQCERDASGQDIPLIHLLFVPDVDLDERKGHSLGGVGGGSKEHLQFVYDYREFGWTPKGGRIRSHPVHVLDGKRVEAEGQSFELAQGNLFVVHVSRKGALRVTQLPHRATRDAGESEVLKTIQRLAPGDSRVQLLDPSGKP